jgi:hypothetical protein
MNSFKIAELTRKPITTQYGEKNLLTVKTTDGQKATIFEKKGVTDLWEIGTTVYADIVEKNGYFNIVLANSDKPVDRPVDKQVNQAKAGFDIESALKEIRKDIKTILLMLEAR